MIISSQGFGHFTQGMNNQDFGIESDKALLILDGCSGAKYSEVGTRLFLQLFSKKEDWDSVEKFEENVKSVFDDLIGMMGKYYPSNGELEKDFIMENLLFTIIGCFDVGDKYIVKLFGDGYIITQNTHGLLSYMKFAYGKCPPYFAYKYCNLYGMNFSDYNFKTFTFDKKVFPKVSIASDGVMPIAKGDVKNADSAIINCNAVALKGVILGQKQTFFDDVTIGIFGGK